MPSVFTFFLINWMSIDIGMLVLSVERKAEKLNFENKA